MDSSAGTTEKSIVGEGGLGSKVKGAGSMSSKDMFIRADRIDLKSLDYQLEKHLSKVWSREETRRPKEVWEIDLSKLDIKNVVAHGTYGTIYRGIYDGLDVAGKFDLLVFLYLLALYFGFGYLSFFCV